MELRHLRYFIAVAEELNFSRAAERLHISQPPLSRQIRDLETELKVRLLDRTPQQVKLTRAGQAVLARARKLLRDADALRLEARVVEQERHEELQIGYAPSPTAVLISRVLSRYHELSPGSRLTLHDLTHTEMLARLKAGKLHAALAIRPTPAEMRGLKFQPIRRYAVGIICDLSNPLARQSAVRPSMVASSKWVVYRVKEFPQYYQWVSKILGLGKGRLNISQECDGVLSVVAAVESGRGLSVVGEFITAVAGDRVHFVPFASPPHFLEVGLLYRRAGEAGIRHLIAASLAENKFPASWP